jgi:hypothetical protein
MLQGDPLNCGFPTGKPRGRLHLPGERLIAGDPRAFRGRSEFVAECRFERRKKRDGDRVVILLLDAVIVISSMRRASKLLH